MKSSKKATESAATFAETLTVQFTLHIKGPLRVVTTSLPEAAVGYPYSCQLEARGGKLPYEWAVTGLPDGLTCSPSGLISGIPTGIDLVFDPVTDSDARAITTTLTDQRA